MVTRIAAAGGITLPDLLELILGGLREGIVATDTAGNVIYSNRASREILGVSLVGHDESARRATTRPVYEDRKTPVPDEEAALVRALKGENVEAQVQWIRTQPEGREVLVTIDATPLRDAAGTISGALAWFRDITEAREQQRQLIQSEDRHRSQSMLLNRVIEGLDEGVVVYDRDGKVMFSNTFSRIFLGVEHAGDGWRQFSTAYSQFDAQTGRLLTPEEHAGAIAMCGASVFDRETIVRGGHLTEDVILLQNAVPLMGEGGTIEGSILWFRDVTETRKAEREKSETAIKLAQAQKMEAVGQLTGGIAHDFNNLMTIIQLYTDTFFKETSREELRDAAQMVRDAADKAADLTQRLLAFSRKQDLAPKVTDINHLVSGFAGLVERALGETIDLRVILDPALWHASVDQRQLENAILNIALNARDAMPDGGTLSIETVNSMLDRAALDGDSDATPGDFVCVAISDTGFGMSAEVIKRAFEPFFTTKDVGKGSGLGLSMVYGFIKQSGGHVTLDSEPGKGTSIRLYLPRAEDELRSAGHKHPTLETMPRGTERLALVEDDPVLRPMMERMLRELGYDVHAFAHGPALLRAMELGYVFDLLQTDIVLPSGVNGVALAREVERLMPGVKVLFMSGYTQNAIAERGLQADGVQLLRKPFKTIELAKRLRTVMTG